MDYATTLNIDQQGRIIIPAKVRKAHSFIQAMY